MVLALAAVLALALAGAAWILLTRRSAPSGPTLATSSVSRELTRLDPFSFFVISGRSYGVEHVVVGTTGTFAIAVGSSSVDGGGYRSAAGRAKRGVRRVRQGAGPAAVHTSMQALVCLPGRQFEPRTVRGARVIPWGSLVAEIAGRQRSVTQNQAQRIAANLGALPGPGNHAQAV